MGSGIIMSGADSSGLSEYARQGHKESVLSLFVEGEKFTLKEVASELKLSYSIVATTVSRLSSSGLVESVEKKGKEKLFGITERGSRVVSSWIEAWEERNNKSFEEVKFDVDVLVQQASDLLNLLVQDEEFSQNHNLQVSPRFLSVPWSAVVRFPEFADALLDDSSQGLSVLGLAWEKLGLPVGDGLPVPDFQFVGVSEEHVIPLSVLGRRHVGGLWGFDAVVTQMSQRKLRLVKCFFECPTCANVLCVPQVDEKFKSPDRCSCGRRGKFLHLKSRDEFVDTKFLVLEEPTELVDTQMQPARFQCMLKESLASHVLSKDFPPGSRVRIVGTPVSSARLNKDRTVSTFHEVSLEASSVIPLDKEDVNVDITDKDLKDIRALGDQINKEGASVLVESFSPYVEGLDHVKDALLLMACSGRNVQISHTSKVDRNSIHVFLIGDTGTAKTTLAKSLLDLVPRSRYAMGAYQSSGAGLIAAVQKDGSFGSGWLIEAGQVVLADGSVCVVDEIDKMREEDIVMFHEVMEEQQASIAKATVKQTLRAWTTILALGNPNKGRFDQSKNVGEQIDVPASILSRFDLIIPLFDVAGKKDSKIVSSILERKSSLASRQKKEKGLVPRELFRKYISYVRSLENPEPTQEAKNCLRDFYLSMRSTGDSSGVAITARTIEALYRLSMAHAKRRLSSTIEKVDSLNSIRIYQECMKSVVTDVHTGRVTEELIFSPDSKSVRGVVLDIIRDLSKDGLAQEDVVWERAVEKGFSLSVVQEVIDSLLSNGDVFSPSTGVLRCNS